GCGGDSEGGGEALANGLSDNREAYRERLLTLMRVNIEMSRTNRAKPKPRIVSVGSGRRGRRDNSQRRNSQHPINAQPPTPKTSKARRKDQIPKIQPFGILRSRVLGVAELGVNWALGVAKLWS